METISNNIKEVLIIGGILSVLYLAATKRNDLPKPPDKIIEFPNGDRIIFDGYYKRIFFTGLSIMIGLLVIATCISKNVDQYQNNTQTTVHTP